MHNYTLLKDDKSTLFWNSCFIDDEDIQYAITHRFNVLYTETSCTNTFKLINKMLRNGYVLEIIEDPRSFISDGKEIPLEPALYAKFIYRDINSDYIKEINIYIEEFEFTQRTKSLLKRHNINTLANLLDCTEEQILNWNNCGNETIADIKNVLSKYNLSLT